MLEKASSFLNYIWEVSFICVPSKICVSVLGYKKPQVQSFRMGLASDIGFISCLCYNNINS